MKYFKQLNWKAVGSVVAVWALVISAMVFPKILIVHGIVGLSICLYFLFEDI